MKDTRSGLWTAREDVAYYACQIRLDAATLARAARHHWGIDCILGEDDSRIRRRPGGFARLRSLALNIMRANGIGNVRQALYRNALSLDGLLAYAVA